MFATRELGQSQWDALIDYPGESVAVPRWQRSITVKRQDYDENQTVAYVSTFSGLLGVKITAPGQDYTECTATAGTGAEAKAVLGENGEVLDWIVTKDGTAVTDGAAVTITGDGTGATGTAIAQPAAAVLTHQEKREFDDGNLMSHDYVNVIRIYEVLPGPWLPFTRWDNLFGPIQGRRRAVLNTGQVATMTATVKTNYEAREGSSVVSWEIEETNSTGSGTGGNVAYPILQRRPYDDRARGAITGTSQLVVTTGSEVSSITETGGVVTRTTYEPFDQFHMLKVVETFVLSAVPVLDEQKFDPLTRTWILTSRKLRLKSAITLGNTFVSTSHPYTVTLVETEAYDYLVSWQVSTTFTEPTAIDLASSFVTGVSNDSYTFPNIIEDLTLWAGSDGLLGFQAAFTKRIVHTQKTFWIYQATTDAAPTLTLTGIPDLAVIDQIIGFGAGIPNVIVDDGTFLFATATVTVNASSPSAATYISTWIGGAARSIDGNIANYKSPFIWRVDLIFIVFEKQISSDYGPP